MKRLIMFFCLIGLFNVAANASVLAIEFDSEEQTQRYQTMLAELRCLVCQNQNLADSNADLANDLKKIVSQQILEGKTDAQIYEFMTDRYGDFVLYRPPLKSSTVLLWLGPLLFLLFGLVFVIFFVKRKSQPTVALSADERDRARSLLDE